MTMRDFIQRYATLKAYIPPYSKLEANMKIYATYFNQLSQSFEPFLEPWSINLEISQKDQDGQQDTKIYSSDFVNIILTYGMAMNIMEVKTKLLDKI